ncbi:MAG: PepSY domain-containing protein [Parvibaculum sp.]
MKHRSIISAACLALSLLALDLGFSEAAMARDSWGPFGQGYARADQDDAREGVRSGDYVSMEQALATVRARYPGRLLDADLNRRAGIYNIKMLSEGEVVQVAVDARNGQIVDVRRGGR